MKTIQATVLAAAFLLAAAASALSPNYSIDWFTIDGGGGTSSGGSYSVSGTIGQPDAGSMSGGAYTLVGGFWGVIQAIQTAGAPLLSVETLPNGTGTTSPTVTSTASSSATGFVLDQATALAVAPTATTWTPAVFPYQTNASQISIITAPSPAQKYYRLRKP